MEGGSIACHHRRFERLAEDLTRGVKCRTPASALESRLRRQGATSALDERNPAAASLRRRPTPEFALSAESVTLMPPTQAAIESPPPRERVRATV